MVTVIILCSSLSKQWIKINITTLIWQFYWYYTEEAYNLRLFQIICKDIFFKHNAFLLHFMKTIFVLHVIAKHDKKYRVNFWLAEKREFLLKLKKVRFKLIKVKLKKVKFKLKKVNPN